MASVRGTGPLGFTTSNGSHVIIPLGMIAYDGKQIVIDSSWAPPPGMTAQDAKDWATYLLAQNEIVVDTSSPGPAFVAEAVHPGDAAHNKITLKITNPGGPVSPPSAASYTLEVTVEDTYTGLTLATLADVIGTSVDDGSKPGLVHLVTPPAPPPATMPDDGQTVDFQPQGPVMQAALATGSFTLEAPGDGGGASTFNVAVAAPGPTFDLTVTWKKSNTGDINSHAAAFGYVLNITKPLGGDYGAPPTGTNTYQLGGGGDPSTSTIAAKPPKAAIPSA